VDVILIGHGIMISTRRNFLRLAANQPMPFQALPFGSIGGRNADTLEIPISMILVYTPKD
jgi:hypothetical protein